ncbi:MAG: histidine kinase [Betaproteobacteria bacterium HGW-Betaproteobacteria-22]|nr:MAG: histidine kinase [Betaproteobacteria bacterium HGW-Betaproteobacteria-22]
MKTISEFFDAIEHLPTLPKVVQDVMQMLADEDVDINALAKVVQCDAVISAKVLQMANSSFYGATRTIKTIDDAIAILGTSRLKSLVVASGVMSAITHVDNLDLRQFWRQSLLAANISRALAIDLGKDAEVAYISGLLHNIGGLLMHMVMPETSIEVDALCRELSADKRQFIERQLLGLDHCQIGEALAIRWNFPSEISHVLRDYATPSHQHVTGLVVVVYLAVHITQGLTQGAAEVDILQNLNAEIIESLGLQSEGWLNRIEAYRELASATELFI